MSRIYEVIKIDESRNLHVRKLNNISVEEIKKKGNKTSLKNNGYKFGLYFEESEHPDIGDYNYVLGHQHFYEYEGKTVFIVQYGFFSEEEKGNCEEPLMNRFLWEDQLDICVHMEDHSEQEILDELRKIILE